MENRSPRGNARAADLSFFENLYGGNVVGYENWGYICGEYAIGAARLFINQ